MFIPFGPCKDGCVSGRRFFNRCYQSDFLLDSTARSADRNATGTETSSMRGRPQAKRSRYVGLYGKCTTAIKSAKTQLTGQLRERGRKGRHFRRRRLGLIIL
jgi:hypothetical protein